MCLVVRPGFETFVENDVIAANSCLSQVVRYCCQMLKERLTSRATCTVIRLQSDCFKLGLASTTMPQVKIMTQTLLVAVDLQITGSLGKFKEPF